MIQAPKLLAALALAAGLLLPRPAAALLIVQEWRDPLFDTNGQWFTTASTLDVSVLTGTGTENVLLGAMSAVEWLRLNPPVGGPDVPQNAYTAQFTVPPSFLIEGNIYARYVDGVFVRLESVQTGGAALTVLINQNTGTDTGGRLVVGAGGLFYGTAISLNQYDLYSTSFVPEPRVSLLLTVGMLGLWRAGKRYA